MFVFVLLVACLLSFIGFTYLGLQNKFNLFWQFEAYYMLSFLLGLPSIAFVYIAHYRNLSGPVNSDSNRTESKASKSPAFRRMMTVQTQQSSLTKDGRVKQPTFLESDDEFNQRS